MHVVFLCISMIFYVFVLLPHHEICTVVHEAAVIRGGVIHAMQPGARVLNSLKGFESTGKPMLPILQAVPATLPFFIVVLCWFSGSSAKDWSS